MKYYVYGNMTGLHPTWTVAVLAVSRTDANRRINGPMWRGGKFQREIDYGSVDATCGDVTDAAAAILHEQLETEYQHYKKVETWLTSLLERKPTWREMADSL